MELRKEIQKILNNNTINKNRVDLLLYLFEKRTDPKNWFEALPLHWRYIYYMLGGILIGFLLSHIN